ncbi:MAG: substrate-binding domain-containing protein [Anaerolineae bacterium]
MKNRVSRREFLQMGGAVTAATILASCAPAATPTAAPVATKPPAATPTLAPAATPTTVPPPAKVHEIMHWSWLGASDAEVWAKLIAQFNEAHTDVQIKLLDVPPDQYATKILATAATGQAPDFGNDTGGTRAEFVDKKVIVPMDGYLRDAGLDLNDFVEGSLQDCRYPQFGDNLWQMPVDMMSFQMEINIDHAEESGLDINKPPTTGDELIEWAKAMTRYEGDKVVRSGFLLTGSGLHVNLMWYIPAFQWGFRNLSDDLKSCAVNPEGAYKAAEWLLALFDKHKVATRDITDRYKAFGTGEGSMFITGPWTLSGYIKQGLNFMTVLVPKIGDELATQRSTGTLEMFVQEDKSRYARTAEALTWLSDNGWIWVTVGRGASPRKSVLAKPDYKTAGHPWKVRGAFVEGLEIAKSGPAKIKAGPDFTAYTSTNVMHRTLDPVWLGQKDFDTAFKELVAEWNKLLEKEWA